MKKILFLMLFVMNVFPISKVIAGNNLSCPPAALIKSMSFIKALPYVDAPQGLIWIIFSRDFYFNNSAWNVWLEGIFPKAENDASRVIKAGEEIMTKLNFESHPKPRDIEGIMTCTYYYKEYVVLAKNPPVSFNA